LFAMGLQNAMVTKVSQSVVRTTHLTGTFTDLGIELSQLFFSKETKSYQKLRRNIYLKGTIVISFFAGGIVGGYGYRSLGIKIIVLAIVIIFVTVIYDYVRYHLYIIRRTIRHKH